MMEKITKDIWKFLTDDTYQVTNVIITLECFLLYLVCWLLWQLTKCFRAYAYHVVEETKSEINKIKTPLDKTPSDEAIVYRYLHKTYWEKRKHQRSLTRSSDEITESDFRPVLRIYDKDRNIHIIYSRKTVWKLAFSESLESGHNEKFGFVFKGLKSWSSEETQGRFANVMQDLFELRQVLTIIFPIFSFHCEKFTHKK